MAQKMGHPVVTKPTHVLLPAKLQFQIVLIISEIDICGQHADINQSFSSSNFTPFCLFKSGIVGVKTRLNTKLFLDLFLSPLIKTEV